MYSCTVLKPVITQVLMPELCRGLEMFLGLLLPIVVYCTLPAYSKFRQAPDDSDVKNEIHRLDSIFLAPTRARGSRSDNLHLPVPYLFLEAVLKLYSRAF